MAPEVRQDPNAETPSASAAADPRGIDGWLLAGVLLGWLGVLISWLLLLRGAAGALGRICFAGSGCDAVLSSRYAAVLGIPLPWLGVGFYLAVFGLLVLVIGLTKTVWRSLALGLALWLSIAGLTFSVLLMYVQFGILRTFCPLCTASALVMLALAATLSKAKPGEMTSDARRMVATLAGMALLSVVALALAMGKPRGEVLAVVDGRPFTREQMEGEVAAASHRLDGQRYALESKWVQDRVDAALLADEARRSGTTADQLLARRTSSVPAPTPAEIEARLAGSGRSSTPENAATAREELLAEKREAARTKMIGEIAARHRVEVFLRPPKLRALKVDLSTAQISGPADAPVQLVVFSDFQCQFCAQLGPVLRQIRSEFPHEVMVAFRHFPLEAHPRAFPAAVAAECAAEQGAFWEYHDRLFAEGGDLSDDRLMSLAVGLGLDQNRFQQCLRGNDARRRVEISHREAALAGLEGAPVVFVNGTRVESKLDYLSLKNRLQAELAARRAKPSAPQDK